MINFCLEEVGNVVNCWKSHPQERENYGTPDEDKTRFFCEKMKFLPDKENCENVAKLSTNS